MCYVAMIPQVLLQIKSRNNIDLIFSTFINKLVECIFEKESLCTSMFDIRFCQELQQAHRNNPNSNCIHLSNIKLLSNPDGAITFCSSQSNLC